MTKKLMIEKIQLKEAALWLAFKEAHVDMGEGSTHTNRRRSEWYSVITLMEELEIQPDRTLPDNQKAIKIFLEQVRDKIMVDDLEKVDFDSRDLNS